jgi:hypothetical protein
MDNDNENIKKKLDFFLTEKNKVHVEKHNKEFLNGFILEKINDDVYLMKDDKYGEMKIFVFDIYDIEEFREVGG